MPVPRTEGDTQIWVMWPDSAETRLVRERPHKLPLAPSKAR